MIYKRPISLGYVGSIFSVYVNIEYNGIYIYIHIYIYIYENKYTRIEQINMQICLNINYISIMFIHIKID